MPSQKEELGIFPRDTTPTPVPVPEKGPVFRVETRADLPGKVKAYPEAKPYGAVRPEDAKELPHRDVITHGPWLYECAHGEHGQTLYLALRWITNEDPSPWTPVSAGVIIP